MTLKFIDLYNTAASQEWSMYDNDTKSSEEFEKSLMIDINKAVIEILYSHPFSFRERTHVIFTVPSINTYEMPAGIITKNGGLYNVRINSNSLKLSENKILSSKKGLPEEFSIRGNKISFYPIPSEKSIVTIDYITLAIGKNSKGDEIFSLKNDNDIILIPERLEEIFKNAVISRAMLNSISAEGDENYSAYKKQSETFYKQLIKYSKGVEGSKKISI